MARARGQVVAKEAIVINVGAREPIWHTQEVWDKRREERVTVTLHEFDPIDPGDEGTPYVFPAGKRVPASHPAVKECPGAFVSIEEAEEMGLESVRG